MLIRRLGGLASLTVVALALVAHQLGWVDGALLLRVAAALALVVGLVGVVQLPWDLTFQARNALARQQASRRRGLAVDEAEVAFTRRSASRALWLAIGLHLVGAALAVAARSLLGPELGGLLALAFLGSMALRPIHAFYLHTRARLFAAEREAEVPPRDAVSLVAELAGLEARVHAQELEREAHRDAVRVQLATLEERAREDASAWRRAATSTDDKLERVLRELERTVERTQQSAEVLAGIRAFVRLVRES